MRAYGRLLAALGMLALALVTFGPGLRAGFVSDTFSFVHAAQSASAADVAAWFVPQDTRFFRPLYRILLALADRLFGLDPLGYHVIALAAHTGSAALLAWLTWRLTGGLVAAGVAGLAFLLSSHAHEVVYDVAALHHAVGGALLLGALVSWLEERRALSVVLAALGLGVNELGLLTLPLVLLTELCAGGPGQGSDAGRRLARGKVAALVALAGLVAAYFAWRLLVAQAWLPNEGTTCLGARCLAVAAAEYVNRLLVRPDAALAFAWTHRPTLAAVSGAIAVGVLALLGPWRWTRWRALALGGGWLGVSVGFVVVALWPYVADRFLHIPAMGLALVLGAAAGEAVAAWPRAGRGARAGVALGLAAVAVWIGLGGAMLRQRGPRWVDAGREAERILAGIAAALPDPPPGARLCVLDAPDSLAPLIPPGNTGPYVFRNGLRAGLRMRYGRSDIEFDRSCTQSSYVLQVQPAVRLIRGPQGQTPGEGGRGV